MLIEFSVSNYRSFREKQTFSMVAAARLGKADNVFNPPVTGEKLPDLLKLAAIYGPNASGKSNLIKAFEVVKLMCERQPTVQSTVLPVTPFRFDQALIDQPSRFEMHFINEGQRYEFHLALTQQRIVEERLIAYPEGKQTLLFERIHQSSGDEYTFGKHLEGGKDLHQLWKKATNPQVLFITQAVANSSEDLMQLRNPYLWLQDGVLTVSSSSMDVWQNKSQVLAQYDSYFAEKIANFLQEVDVPVNNIRFEQETYSEGALQGLPTIGAILHNNKTNAILNHRTELGDAEFEFHDESEGTKNLIGFWLPWSARDSDFSIIRTLVVDELDNSLHPEIVAALVTKHIKAEYPSQLIFTTHDTHLMDTKLLRRDQFWLTERDSNGATQLRSIHDFVGRESEDLEKRYYEGRYRGLPFVRKK